MFNLHRQCIFLKSGSSFRQFPCLSKEKSLYENDIILDSFFFLSIVRNRVYVVMLKQNSIVALDWSWIFHGKSRLHSVFHCDGNRFLGLIIKFIRSGDLHLTYCFLNSFGHVCPAISVVSFRVATSVNKKGSVKIPFDVSVFACRVS